MVNGVTATDINVMDRGFQFGDGLFETMRVVNEEIPLWQKHWQRLIKGCEVLSITPPEKIALEHDISSITDNVSNGVVKLIVTRGIGGRGYAVTEIITPEVVLIQTEYPDYPESYWQEGVEIRICETRLSHQPALSGIKHMNRLEQILARNEWSDSSISEGLMLSDQGNVIEGTMSNLFMVKNGSVITPTLNECGVAGVMRETVLTFLDEEAIPYETSIVSQGMLASVDEVFLTNSVIGLWPVKKIGDTVYPVGPVSKVIQKKINNLVNA